MKGIKQIKNYRLTREIGKGTAGTVYEAIDEKTNKLVAIKSILSSKLKDKRVMENFKRELKLLHGLNHFNIIKITGVEKTVNNIYLILEYCNGGNLYEYLYYYKKTYGTPLPEENVQVILRQLIDGLEYMHNCRTIHRDIKLENILVNFNAVPNKIKQGDATTNHKIDYSQMNLLDITVKIADLGYARELEGAGVASTMCGTPITMAPDIIGLFNTNDLNKDNKYNSKVDLWSLGAITYELIVGRPVFISNNVKQLFEEIMSGKYTIPQNLKISLEAIAFINGLLQFYPDKRMNWNQIRNHPFIVNDMNSFHYIELTSVDNNNVMVDTKDCENLLWVLYKTNFANNINIDKIDNEVYESKLHDREKSEDIAGKDLSVINQANIVRNNSEKDSLIEVKQNAKFVNQHQNNFEENNLNAQGSPVKDNKRDESEDMYEEANDEICIGDDAAVVEKPVDTIELEDIKKQVECFEKPEEEIKTEIINEPKRNTIFGKLLSEMEQDLKNSKNNSKLGSSDKDLHKEIKEITKEETEIKQELPVYIEHVHDQTEVTKINEEPIAETEITNQTKEEPTTTHSELVNEHIIPHIEDKLTSKLYIQDKNRIGDSYYDCGNNKDHENKPEQSHSVPAPQTDNTITNTDRIQVIEPDINIEEAHKEDHEELRLINRISDDNTNNQANSIEHEANKLTDTNTHLIRDSKPTEINRECNSLQLDSMSDERISSNFKGNCKNKKNDLKFKLVTISFGKTSTDYMELKEAGQKVTEKEDESDSLWEIISTTSLTNEDITVKMENYDFDLIQEYF